MRAALATTGRTFVVAIDHGEDFFDALGRFCAEHQVRAGHIPTFIGGFSTARLVGTCQPLKHPERPLWDEVTVETLEVLGGGTLAWDPETDQVSPHIHLTTGLKADAAHARTSHLLGGTVQFIAELIIQEITTPALTRPKLAQLYDVPLLTFDESRGMAIRPV